jgi:hypothetical protein
MAVEDDIILQYCDRVLRINQREGLCRAGREVLSRARACLRVGELSLFMVLMDKRRS